MPTSTALGAINAPYTSEIFLMLLTLQHASLPHPLYFVNNFENITSNGVKYIAWPFSLPMPEIGTDTLPTLTLSIDNVDASIAEGIKQISTPIDVQLQVVLASDPDQIELGPLYLRMRATETTLATINGTLIFEDLLNEPFPFDTYTPGNAPGLF